MNGRILQQSGPLQKKNRRFRNKLPKYQAYDSAAVELEKKF